MLGYYFKQLGFKKHHPRKWTKVFDRRAFQFLKQRIKYGFDDIY